MFVLGYLFLELGIFADFVNQSVAGMTLQLGAMVLIIFSALTMIG